jgi:hypothetical protein
MKSMKFLIVIISFLLVVSCDNKIEKEIEGLNKVLMKGHDEVMPKSMNIAEVKKELIASVENAPDSIKNTALELSTQLQKAEDDMYTWMDNYGKAMNDVKDKNEKLELYKGLQTEIEKIKALTDESIVKAKTFTTKQKK